MSVLELRVRLVGCLVIHHDHRGHRATAKYIQGLQSLILHADKDNTR
jgi:hypothetical protein